ncbi:kinase-like domain-containing protein [Rhizophagus irregularis DAOM 181602=DAOM 197198]|nr:kinase-like domain-containing protein [Rhizophagus irregularis DAOM 181602=DAOM 197198]
MLNILMKEDLDLNENLNEFLKEWKYHASVLSSNYIIYFYGFTEDPNTSKYMVVMDYANKDLMKKCWNEDSSERPSSKEVLNLRSLDENTSKKSNEILENENSQASVEANEILVSEDLNDYTIKDLGSLDIKTDDN